MKKILLVAMAVLSVSALASENNVYIKVGGDLYTNYNTISREDGNVKTDLITSDKGRGIGGFLEVTRNLTPEFEAGLGAGYIGRYDGKDHIIGEKDNKVKINNPRYSSIPVYATAKFNIANDSEITPYVKADIGYAFNKINGDLKIEKVDSGAFQSFKLKNSNGVYGGVGLGVEYNNFTAEVSYHHTNTALTIAPAKEVKDPKEIKGPSKAYSNNAVRLSVGYKFNF